MRPPIDNGRILVTGASSGIGREMARQLAGRAGTLLLVARRKERLEELAAELTGAHPQLQVEVHPCDLLNAEARKALLEAAGELDILINNAGMGDVSLLEMADWSKLERMLQLNVVALTELTCKVVPGMLERGRGGILNVSSGFGHSLMPGVAAYAASKHYVTAFTECLRLELQNTCVVVGQVCPGPIPTEFEEVSGNPTGQEVPSIIQISAEACARQALRAFGRGRAMVITGWVHWFVLCLNAMTPRWLLRLVARPLAGTLRKRQRAALAAAPTGSTEAG